MIRSLRGVALALCTALPVLPAAADDVGDAAPERPLLRVWPGVAPGSESWTQQQQDTQAIWGDRIVRNVVSPTLEVFLPAPGTATGTGVMVCPGGAFRFLSIDTEGTQVARWLADNGIAAFVLRYRLGETVASDPLFAGQVFAILAPLFKPGPALMDDMKRYGPPAIADGRQAMKLLRSRAQEFGLRKDRIGVLGFSAGGVVGTGVALEHDADSRPDFFAAIYPGPWPLDAIPKSAPPLFIAAANDDGITVSGAKPLDEAWRKAGLPVEAHYYASGGHGFGMKKQNKESDAWTDQLLAWLDGRGLLKPAK